MTDFGRFMVLFKQGYYHDLEGIKKIADYLNIPVTEEELQYGMDNIFFAKRKYNSQNGSEKEKKLFAIRMFATSCVNYINKNAYPKFENEADTADIFISATRSDIRAKAGIGFWKRLFT